MRRFPISWDRTLTALGFRRRINRFKRRRYGRLTSRHELLEVRALLSATQHDLPDEAIVAAVYSVGPTVTPIRPEYVLAGSAAGDTPSQFEVTTEYSTSGEPLAVIRLKDDLVRIDRSLQELTIELRLGETVLTRHEVLIDIADDLFVHEFREAREQEAADASASLELATGSPQGLVATIGVDGYFNDLRPTSSRQAQSTQSLNLNEDSAATSRQNAQRNTESIARLAQIARNSSVELLDKAAKVSFYAGIQQAVGGAKEQRGNLDKSQAEQNDRLIGGLALAYGRQIAQDLGSGDSQIALAAARSRDALLAAVDPYYTMLTGLGVNQVLTPQEDSSARVAFTVFMVEEPSLEIDGVIRIDLGDAKAMVQVTTSGAIQGPVGRSLPVMVDVPPMHDAYIYGFEEWASANYDGIGLLTYDIGSVDRAISLLGFDLSEYAGSVPTNATLKLTATYASDETMVSVSAHKDLWGLDPLSSWEESTLTYNEYLSDLEAGFGAALDTKAVSPGLVSFNVTEAIQRALLLGDSNLNGVLDPAGPAGDIAAFYLAATNFTAYASQYAGLELSGVANGYLFRNDANLDGVVDRFDAGTYFKRMGVREGDFNQDGIVDGRDYAIWSANYGSTTAKFAGGDGSFDGVVNALDYTVWRDNVGQVAAVPADPEASFRLLAAGYQSEAVFYDSEDGTAPVLTVEVAPRVVINNFGTDLNGALQVTYEVQHGAADDAELALYQVVDGVRTPLLTSVALNDQVGTHVATLPNTFSILNPDSDYTLVAEIDSASSVATWRSFTGGVFATADGAIHAIGTSGDDTVVMTDSAIAVSAPGLGDLGFVEFFYNDVPVYVHTGDGEDTIQVNKFYTDELFLSGGNDADAYIFAPSFDVITASVQIADSSGIDEVRFDTPWWSANSRIDLDSNAPQTIDTSYGTNALTLQLVGVPVEVVAEFPVGQVAGRGYSYDIVVENTSDAINGDDNGYSLREAIEHANALADSGKPQTIGFSPELFDAGAATISLTYKATPTLQAPQELQITGDVTIVGPGPELLHISGGGLTRVFNVVAGADASIQGLTVRNGRAAAGYVNGYPVVGSFGGGIYSEGTLHLNDVVVRDNLAVHGGGVYSEGDTSIFSSSIYNNNVYYSVGGVFQWYGNLTIVDTDISENDSINGGAPGGLWIVDAESINLDRLTVARNNTNGMGGIGIGTNVGVTTTGTLKNSLIRNNEVNWTGGGIGFALNGAIDFDVSNTTISGNKAGHGGAGVNFEGRPTGPGVTFTNVTIFDNTVTGIGTTTPQGGGIRIEDRFGGADGTKLSLYNTIVAGNYVVGSENNIAGGINTASSHNLIGLGGAGGLVHNPTGTSGSTVNQAGISSTGIGPLSGNYARDGFHPLTATSPAVDSANDLLATETDQRGKFRHDYLVNGRVSDIGAYEFAPHAIESSGSESSPNTIPLQALANELLTLAGDPSNPPQVFRVRVYVSDPLAGNISKPGSYLSPSQQSTSNNPISSFANIAFIPNPAYGGSVEIRADILAEGPVGIYEGVTVVLKELFIYPELIVVNSLRDGRDSMPGDGVADAGRNQHGREVTLRAAIEEVNELAAYLSNQGITDWEPTIRFDPSLAGGQVIALDPALGVDGTAFGLGIAVNASVAIEGGDATAIAIDAGGSQETPNRVFTVGSAAELRLSGITLSGGYAKNSDGGAIHNSGTVRLDSVVVRGNASEGEGGGIYSAAGSSLYIDRTTIDSNRAAHSGGVRFITDGVASADEVLSVLNSTISNNVATASLNSPTHPIAPYGGGLVAGQGIGSSSTRDIDGTVTIKNTTFSGNRAENTSAIATGANLHAAGVGGIAILNPFQLTIDGVTIYDNRVASNASDPVSGFSLLYDALDDPRQPTLVFRNSIVASNTRANGTPKDLNVSAPNTVVRPAAVTATNLLIPTVASDLNFPVGAISHPTIETLGLSELGDHGGPTRTHALLADSTFRSIAIRNGARVPGLGLDQRGAARDGLSDAGAFEYIGAPSLTDPAYYADFNNDGRDDEVLFDPIAGKIFVDTGDAAGPGPWATHLGAVSTVRLGDYNGDGRDDIAFQNSENVWVLGLSESNRFLLINSGQNPGWEIHDILVGDFDGDGADELIGRTNSTGAPWGMFDWRNGSVSYYASVGGSFRSANFQGKVFVGDANRDGRDDLIGLDDLVSAPSSSIGTEWHVRLSSADHVSGVNLEGAYSWGDWFDSPADAPLFDTSTRRINADVPLQFVAEQFAKVYNDVELELYYGIRKGPQATLETKAGSPLDQAALLTQRLSSTAETFDRFQPTVVTGVIEVSVETAARWVGAKDIGSGVYPALTPLLQLLDPQYTGTNSTAGQSVSFRHAWVRVKLPRFDSTNVSTNIPFGTDLGGDNYIDLDPSWKFKDRNAGIELPADLFSSDGFANGLFDEIKYLDSTVVRSSDPNNPAGFTILPDTPLEFFEGQVQAWITKQHPGSALSDVPFDGDSPTLFDGKLLLGWSSLSSVPYVSSVAQGSYDAIMASAAKSKELTARMRFTTFKGTTTLGSAPSFTQILSIANVSRSPLLFDSRIISSSGPGADTVALQYLIGGSVFNTTNFSLVNGESLNVTLEIAEAGQSFRNESNVKVGDVIDDLNPNPLPWRRLRLDRNSFNAIAFDAGQVSSGYLNALERNVQAQLATVQSGDSGRVGTRDIPSILAHDAALYAFLRQDSLKSIGELTGSVSDSHIQVVAISTSRDYAHERGSGVEAEDLRYTSRGAVLADYEIIYGPNVTSYVPLDGPATSISAEILELYTWQLDAVDRQVIAIGQNSDDLSSVRILQHAYAGQEVGTADPAALGRFSSRLNTANKIEVVLNDIEGYGALQQPWLGLSTPLVVWTSSEALQDIQKTELDDISASLYTALHSYGFIAPSESQLQWFAGLFPVGQSVAFIATQGLISSSPPRAATVAGSAVSTAVVRPQSGILDSYTFQPVLYTVGAPTLSSGVSSGATMAEQIGRALLSSLLPNGGVFGGIQGGGNVASGNVQQAVTDIQFPASGVPLSLTRTYNSTSARDIGLGVGWAHSFGDRLLREASGSNHLIWYTSQGTEHRFEWNGSGYESPSELLGELNATSNGWVYVDRGGNRITFEKRSGLPSNAGHVDRDPVGRLVSKLDLSGNGVVVEYETAVGGIGDKIDYVRDVHAYNRRLEFTYMDEGNVVRDHIQGIQKHYLDETVGVPIARTLAEAWVYDYVAIGGRDFLAGADYPDTGISEDADVSYAYHYYGDGQSPGDPAIFSGLLKSAIRPNGDTTEYEYFTNGRVSRISALEDGGTDHSEFYSYDLVNGKTIVHDANGNQRTYFYNREGLITRVINPDRTRSEIEWGVGTAVGVNDEDYDGVYDGTEFLQTKVTDELGAVATFEYSTSTTATGSASGSVERELHRATSRHFPQADGVTLQRGLVTEYEYLLPNDVVRVQQVAVDPSGENRRTVYEYYGDGLLLLERNPLLQITRYTYHGSEAGASEGLVKSITSPRGHDESGAGSLTYNDSLGIIDVLSGTLTVTLDSALGAGGTNSQVVIDAIRLDRWITPGANGDAPQQTFVVDDSSPGFVSAGGATVSATATGWGLTNDSATLLTAGEVAASNATWTFSNIPAGQYRISVILASTPGVSIAEVINYSVKDGSVQRSVAPAGGSSAFWSNQTTFAYDAAGNVTIRRVEGRPVAETIAYHHTGQPLSVTDATGRVVQSAYDNLGRLRQTLLVGDSTSTNDDLLTAYSYDANGQLSEIIDALGRKNTTLYDDRGLVTKVVNADRSYIEHKYDAVGNRMSTTDELGRTTRYKYDSQRRLIQTAAPDGAIGRFKYDAVGRVVASIDALGRTTRYIYDAQGRLSEQKVAAGEEEESVTSSKHNVFGELIESRDGEGNITQYFYDKLGRVVKTMVLRVGSTDAGPLQRSNHNSYRPVHVETVAYDPDGNVIEKIIYNTASGSPFSTSVLLAPNLRSQLPTISGLDAGAYQQTTVVYDSFNRLTVTTHADGAVSSIEYDAAGRVRFVEGERGARTETQYDKYGRLAVTILPDPSTGESNGQGPRSTQSYDSVGNLVSAVDPNGNLSTFDYDNRNRLIAETDAIGSVSRSIFDAAGQLVTGIDANGVAVAMRYDNRGRLIQRSWVAVDPDREGLKPLEHPAERREYDSVGNLIASTDARGYTSHFVYDNLNRLIEQRLPRTEVLNGTLVRLGLPELDTANAYIEGATLRDEDAITRYDYDKNGNVVSEAEANLATTIFSYDEMDRLAAETLPDADVDGPQERRRFRYVYDGYGNIVVTNDENADTGTFFRIDTFAYDARNRLIEEVFVAGANEGDADKLRNVYEYDVSGNLTALKVAARWNGTAYVEGPETITTRFEYDLLNRVIAEHLDAPFLAPNPNAPGQHSKYHGYDAAGNRNSETYTIRQGDASSTTVKEYVYDSLNRAIEVNEDVYGIRARSQYRYDPVGNLVLEVDATGVATYHTYDDLGRLVETVAGDTRPYTESDGLLVEWFEYDAGSNLTAYTNGEGDRTEYLYNTTGQVVEERVRSVTDIITEYAYTKSGDREKVVDPNGNVTTFHFDKLHRVSIETQGSTINGTNSRYYNYTTDGNLQSIEDRNGRFTVYAYDRLDRLRTEKWFTDSLSSVHTDTLEWQYDKLSRVIKTMQFDLTVSSTLPIVYDAYQYDGLDRVTSRFNYEPTWNRTAGQVIGPEVRQTYRYDDLDHLRPGELTATEYVLTFEPKQGGAAANLDFARSVSVTDQLGRITRITENGHNVTTSGSVRVKAKDITFSYDSAGRMASVARRADKNGNGSVFDLNPTGINSDNDFYFSTFYGYDTAGRLDSISHSRISDSYTFATYEYGYDNASRIVSIDATARFTSVSLNRFETFSYDAAGRLDVWIQDLRDRRPQDGPGAGRDLGELGKGYIDYSPDAAGNRMDNGQHLLGETHNRVRNDNDYSYSYDNEGNLRDEYGLATDLTTQYFWDNRNRLVEVRFHGEGGAVTGRIEYRYNTDDLRTRKVVYSSDLNIGSIEHYIYNGSNVTAILDGGWTDNAVNVLDVPTTQSQFQRRVQAGPGTDAALFEEVFRVGGFNGAAEDELYWAATDHAGSVRDVLRNNHDLINHIEYDAYGDILFAIDPGKNDIGPANSGALYKELAIDSAFAGREWDSEAGLYYNRARWYDAAQGRFISEDPAGFSGGDSNLYRYAGGDPANLRDPSGLFADSYDLGNYGNDDFGSAWGGYDFDYSFGLDASFTASYNSAINFGNASNGWGGNAGYASDYGFEYDLGGGNRYGEFPLIRDLGYELDASFGHLSQQEIFGGQLLPIKTSGGSSEIGQLLMKRAGGQQLTPQESLRLTVGFLLGSPEADAFRRSGAGLLLDPLVARQFGRGVGQTSGGTAGGDIGFTLSNAQTVLDVVGFVPVLGTPADLTNMGIEAYNGNYWSAALAFGGIFGLDYAVKGFKYGKKLLGYGEDYVGDVVETTVNTVVYRVEGLPNTRITIGEGGRVTVQGDQMLFLNFGDKVRAEEFLSQRLGQGMTGVELKSFEVPASFVDDLRSTSVPESMAKQFPGRPIVVDTTKAADQFGLRPEQINKLQGAAIQGTGRSH